MPRKIGIVTSETGAAIHDIIRIARRRNPNVGILVAPCAVQGESAAPEIVRAIRRLNENGECDVLLVGRGGGSIEDLWAFNEEIVARAIIASRIPVISCVGHEVDFTIADFVADLRAPTPSAAAELAVPVRDELVSALDDLRIRLSQALKRGQDVRKSALRQLTLSPAMQYPNRTLLQPSHDALSALESRRMTAMERRLEKSRHRLNAASGMLRTLNPEGVLERGYSIVMNKGRMTASAAQIAPGDVLTLRMADGSVCANAMKVERESRHGEEKDHV